MRGLTIRQPWATALAAGLKLYETRSWQINYRGLIAIHAGGIPPKTTACIPKSWRLDYPLGVVLAVANLDDILPTEELLPRDVDAIERGLGDFSPGRFAWKFSDMTMLQEPIPMIGRQGLWKLHPDHIDLLTSAWEARTR